MDFRLWRRNLRRLLGALALRGLLVEVQGTAEGAPFSRGELDQMLDLAAKGIAELHDLQRQTVAS